MRCGAYRSVWHAVAHEFAMHGPYLTSVTNMQIMVVETVRTYFLSKPIGLVQGPHRKFRIGLINQYGLTLISDVVIAWMLMPLSASAERNIFAATPAWLRMPMPTTETLATSAEWVTLEEPDLVLHPIAVMTSIALRKSLRATVKVMLAVEPSGRDILHDHVDR